MATLTFERLRYPAKKESRVQVSLISGQLNYEKRRLSLQPLENGSSLPGTTSLLLLNGPECGKESVGVHPLEHEYCASPDPLSLESLHIIDRNLRQLQQTSRHLRGKERPSYFKNLLQIQFCDLAKTFPTGK